LIIAVATVAYAIVAGFQLHAINGQLKVMSDALDETHRTNQATTNQMWQAVGNINWEARSMDLSQKSTKKAMEEEVAKLNAQARATGKLVDSAAKEAEFSATQAINSSGQLDILKSELNLSQRPWIQAKVSISDPGFHYEALNDAEQIGVTSVLLNSGHSPAGKIGVFVTPQMTWFEPGGTDPASQIAQTCNTADDLMEHRPLFVFPDTPTPFPWTVQFERSLLAQRRASRVFTGKITIPYLVVCIAYQSTFDKVTHHTTYVLDILKEGDRVGSDFDIGQDIPADKLHLQCSIMYGCTTAN
jgi:hypothetical protein